MRMLFQQRLFSWFDSYDIYGENGETLFTVEGKLAWGHCLHILDAAGHHIATVQQQVLTFLPRFDLYIGEEKIGTITKQFTLFKPCFTLDCMGWQVIGDWLEWDYTIVGPDGRQVAAVGKELLRMTDTYVIDVVEPSKALGALMVALAIDAEKCSRN